MSAKSATCRGKKTLKPLTEYESEAEALEGANYAREKFSSPMVPYRCAACDKWHLSPASRQTPSHKCSRCTGADGTPKDSYRNQQEARRRAAILRQEQGATLRVYSCEHGDGWHLTRG
jgi:hypothetical protein